MAKRKGRNELIAGVFILFCVGMGFVVVLLLSDVGSLFVDRREVAVLFRSESVKGLRAGSKVKFRGLPVGKVTGVELDFGNLDEIRVTIAVPPQFELYTDASLAIGTATLGGGAWIDIDDVGGAGEQVAPADLEHPILGGKKPNPMIADAAEAAGLNDAVRTDLQITVEAVKEIALAAREVVVAFRKDLLPKINTTADNVVAMTGDGRAVMADIRSAAPDVLAKVNSTVTELEAIVKENRPVIGDAVGHVQKMARTLDVDGQRLVKQVDDALVQLQQALAEAKKSLANIRELTATARDVVVVNRENLNDTLANFKEGSDHFRGALAEIRRNPWRLLHKPKQEEVHQANVMQAARAFAEGATRLRDTTTRLKVLVDSRGDQLGADREVLLRMMADLQESFTRFEKAQRALYDQLQVPQ
jgi:ABC-type transporter Mla subunit MlaD